VHGVSTRSVDGLVKALGADSGISKSEVSRICAHLDTRLTAFRGRPLDHTRFPCTYLDATYCKARVAHQIVSRAVVIATGITEDGGREVLGVMVGDSETEVFWTQFLRSRCTTSGSPSPAATYPKAAWTRSTPPNPAKAPPHSPTPRTQPMIDHLHHVKGHDPFGDRRRRRARARPAGRHRLCRRKGVRGRH